MADGEKEIHVTYVKLWFLWSYFCIKTRDWRELLVLLALDVCLTTKTGMNLPFFFFVFFSSINICFSKAKQWLNLNWQVNKGGRSNLRLQKKRAHNNYSWVKLALTICKASFCERNDIFQEVQKLTFNILKLQFQDFKLKKICFPSLSTLVHIHIFIFKQLQWVIDFTSFKKEKKNWFFFN